MMRRIALAGRGTGIMGVPVRRLHLGRLALGVCTLALAGCIVPPPTHIDNICAIFREKEDWYAYAKAAEQRWGTPIAVQMAIIAQESGFHEEIRPPRTWILGIIPWTRPSSAYGYAQALDSTWAWYQQETGNYSADRDDFADAVDFVAWYVAQSYQMLGISKSDAYSQYLAYHEGQAGFRNKTYADEEWLKEVAWRVNARAARYARQLRGCRKELESDDGWWFF